jgi:DnaJ-class molecular chaperone
MSWLKGTDWRWDNEDWGVKLEKDGTLEAPITQCQMSCKWSAENGKLYLLLGDAGVGELDTEKQKPANMKGLRMQGRFKNDGTRIKLSFLKIFDHSAVDLDKDLYGALGLPDDADEAAIKKAYRKLSIQYHPDKNPDEASRLKFSDVRDAYEILNDPDKKILYDTGGMEAVHSADKGEVQKTDDFESPLSVTLDELYTGQKKNVKINRRVVCRGCRLRPNDAKCRGCNRCPNEVKTVKVQMGPFLTQQQQQVPSKEKCKQEDATVEATIEKGMLEGEQLSFPRMADQRPGMLPGAVNLKLKVAKHGKFVRRGNDLHMDMSVSLAEALLGWSQTIRHIDDHSVELKIDSVTKDRQVIRIAGEGMPLRDDPASFGDLLVKVQVVFPKSLSGEQRKAVDAIFGKSPPRTEL